MVLGKWFGFFVSAIAMPVLISPALADSIDGNWCHDDGRRLSIRGPEIVTASGARIEGDYRRHEFSYRVPASEPGAGQTADLKLVNEDTVHLRRGGTGPDSAPETWVRCSPSIS